MFLNVELSQHYMQNHRHHRDKKRRQQQHYPQTGQGGYPIGHGGYNQGPDGLNPAHQGGYYLAGYSENPPESVDYDLTQSTEQSYEVCEIF